MEGCYKLGALDIFAHALALGATQHAAYARTSSGHTRAKQAHMWRLHVFERQEAPRLGRMSRQVHAPKCALHVYLGSNGLRAGRMGHSRRGLGLRRQHAHLRQLWLGSLQVVKPHRLTSPITPSTSYPLAISSGGTPPSSTRPPAVPPPAAPAVPCCCCCDAGPAAVCCPRGCDAGRCWGAYCAESREPRCIAVCAASPANRGARVTCTVRRESLSELARPLCHSRHRHRR